jgi:hypothetical protein
MIATGDQKFCLATHASLGVRKLAFGAVAFSLVTCSQKMVKRLKRI